MFISKKKQIEILKSEKEKFVIEIGSLLKDNANLKKENAELHDTIDKIKDNLLSTPKDCKPGELCEACRFGKGYIVGRGFSIKSIYFCNKNEACPAFVPHRFTEVNDDD